MTEALIGLLAIIPALMAMDHLGRLQDMERAAIAGTRYAVWEEISGRSSSDDLRIAIEDRIHGSDHAPIVDTARLYRQGISLNPLWHDREGALRAVAADDTVRRKGGGRGGRDLPRAGIGVRNIAYGESIPSAIAAIGLSGGMLGLPRERLLSHQVRISAQPRLEDGPPKPLLTLEARGAIAPGDWQASDDRAYQRRAERIVASEPVDVLTQPAQTMGAFAVFKEGRYARSTDFVPESDRFPIRR